MSHPSPTAGTMRTGDILGLSFSALSQQKVRTLLTLAGVVIGTFTLVVSLAVGQGVDRAIIALFEEDDRIRKISVSPKNEPDAGSIPAAEREPKGEMSDARRHRLGKMLVAVWARTHGILQRKPLTLTRMEELARLDHVESAEPMVFLWNTKADFQSKTERVDAISAGRRSRRFQGRLVAGSVLSEATPRGAIVDEFLLYKWGFLNEHDVAAAIGRRFRLESPEDNSSGIAAVAMIANSRLSLNNEESDALERALRRLAVLARFLPLKRDERDVLIRLLEGRAVSPNEQRAARFSEEFTIVGVMRAWTDDDPKQPLAAWGVQEADLYLPTKAAAAFYLRHPRMAKEGFPSVELTIDEVAHVKELARKVESLGYTQFSFAEFIDTIRMNVLMVTFATAFVAFIALLVAALGITNTMIMSVLERTHEIGIMKALGARTGQIRLIFLVEGAILGLCGGLLGVFLAYLASYPGDSIAKSIMEPQTQTQVKGSLFVYPFWLILGAPALAGLITTLAAIYPAHRAASVDPITSLRHE